MKALTLVLLLISLTTSAGCGPARLEPKNRPSGVPSAARWVGGADGGAYVRCTVDAIRKVNPCSVWNDYTGAVVETGDYKLVKENRPADQTELKVSFPDFGGKIYLEGGLVLERSEPSRLPLLFLPRFSNGNLL